MKALTVLSFSLSLMVISLSTACQDNKSNSATDSGHTAPDQAATASPSVFENIDASTFQEKMKEENAVVLDVRTPQEIQRGMIEGAVTLDFRQADFRDKVAQLDKTKTYLVYCQSGIRSAKTCEIMAQMGFDSLYNLNSGFRTWPR